MSTLYERIGGEEVVRSLVGDFYRRVLADRKLAPFFADSDVEHLERMQFEFFCVALDGPGESTVSLAQVHAGRGIEREHVQRFLDLLFLTLEETDHPLSREDRTEVIARINTYVGEIVGEVSVDG